MNAPFPIPGAPPSDVQTRPLIAFDDVSKIYPSRDRAAEVVALRDVNLDVPEGAIVGVIGKSGAGKSTLIRLVNGLERPTGGRVIVDNTDITALAQYEGRLLGSEQGLFLGTSAPLGQRSGFADRYLQGRTLKAGEHFKLRCPLAGSYSVGEDWAGTH